MKMLVHFVGKSFYDFKKLCGKNIYDFGLNEAWTHNEKDVTCKKCLKLMMKSARKKSNRQSHNSTKVKRLKASELFS